MVNQKIAHIRTKDHEVQYLWDHLNGVSNLSRMFSGKIGLEQAGEVLGLLHDLGKASEEFQNYLKSAEGLINPDEDGYIDFANKGER